MRKPLGMRLHTRLWLASVLAFAIFTLLVSWVVRQTTEPPLRAVVVRDPQGEVIGSGQARYRPADVLPDEVRAPIPGLEHVPYGKFGPGPEFIRRWTMDRFGTFTCRAARPQFLDASSQRISLVSLPGGPGHGLGHLSHHATAHTPSASPAARCACLGPGQPGCSRA